MVDTIERHVVLRQDCGPETDSEVGDRVWQAPHAPFGWLFSPGNLF